METENNERDWPLVYRFRAALETSLTPARESPTAWNLAVGVMIVIGLAVRLATIGAPALDRTHWKEIDYLMISQGFQRNGYNLARPEIWWPAEEPRVTAMELPVVPYVASLAYATMGFSPLTARGLTLLASLVMIVYVFLLTRRELGLPAAVLGALAATLFPLWFPPWTRSLYSDPIMIALSVAAVYHYAEWTDRGRRTQGFLGAAAFSMAVAIKLTPLYLLLPIAYAAYRSFGVEIRRYRALVISIVLALVVPAVWYAYAYYLTVTSIDVFGIFGGHDKLQTWTMITDPQWLREIYGRLTWGIVGGMIGTGLVVCGMAILAWLRRGKLIFWYLLSVVFFLIIVAEGHWDAPYRQLTFIPPLAMIAGAGAVGLAHVMLEVIRSIRARLVANIDRTWAVIGLGAVPVLLLAAWNHDRIFGWDPTQPADPGQWLVAQEIRALAEPGDKLVWIGGYTIHKGGNDLSPVLYWYSGIQGWTLQDGQWDHETIDELVAKGARFLAANKMSREPAGDEFLRQLRRRYRVVIEEPERELLLLDLRHASNPPEFEEAI